MSAKYNLVALTILALTITANITYGQASNPGIPARMSNSSTAAVVDQPEQVVSDIKPVVPVINTGKPYLARITGENVNIRSGPGEAYYDVNRLNRDALVIVVEEHQSNRNWAKILPAPGCFSYISKQFVRADSNIAEQADSAEPRKITGTVIGNEVLIRAGSRAVAPVNARVIQTKLNFGEKVEIIGQRDNFYIIVPPKGCYFWISMDFLQKIRNVEDSELANYTTEMLTKIKVDDIQAVRPEPASDDKKINSQFQTYRNLVKIINEETQKPLIQRDLSGLREQIINLKEIAATESLKTACDNLLTTIERQEIAIATFEQSITNTDNLLDKLSRLDEHAVRIKQESGLTADGQQRIISGTLAHSYVFAKSEHTRRFKLLDSDGLFACYAVPENPSVDLSTYLDKKVSLTGIVNFDGSADADVMTVTAVNVIE